MKDEYDFSKAKRGAILDENGKLTLRGKELLEKRLKHCPCGKTPEYLLIDRYGSKWAFVCGNCCNEWHIEFRLQYNNSDSPEGMKLAIEAWNESPRG